MSPRFRFEVANNPESVAASRSLNRVGKNPSVIAPECLPADT